MIYRDRKDLWRASIIKSIDDEFVDSSEKMTMDNELGLDTTLYTGYIWGLLFAKRLLEKDIKK